MATTPFRITLDSTHSYTVPANKTAFFEACYMGPSGADAALMSINGVAIGYFSAGVLYTQYVAQGGDVIGWGSGGGTPSEISINGILRDTGPEVAFAVTLTTVESYTVPTGKTAVFTATPAASLASSTWAIIVATIPVGFMGAGVTQVKSIAAAAGEVLIAGGSGIHAPSIGVCGLLFPP